MTEDLSAETLERAADRYGISLSDEARAERLQAARNRAMTANAFDVDPPTADRPAEIRDGDDPHNAFRSRFELSPTADGTLEGLEIAVKENVAVAGVETTCGSPGFAYAPPYSATVVERLRDAGAAVVGTTNMDEFAFFTTGETCAHGRTENPVVDGCVPGGSSSGSGAAVAAGLVDAAIGTDTGGSIRIPASFCGLVGVKPTHRLVSRFGVVDLSLSLDHVGPLAPDVETAAAVTAAIAGPDVADPSTHATPGIGADEFTADLEAGVDGLALGVVEESMAAVDDAVERTIEGALAELEAAGATVTRRSIDGYDLVGPAVGAITGAEFASFVANGGVQYGVGTGATAPLRDALASATDDCAFGENVQEQLHYNGALNDHFDGRHYAAAMDFRRRFTATVRELFSEVDALVTPTTPMPAPPFGTIEGMSGLLRTIGNTAPFNLTGTPAVSVPCGETEAIDGDASKPVGFQVVAAWHDEATALRVARAVETNA
ncbi:amidase [Natronococcus wangiae]|uniref:amidase n=1 Tax=Natronococcus wangiae TaxID=3068275 RepID=UPI00273F0568|nr:amidase family protein [Natronococcus sp. AD5]